MTKKHIIGFIRSALLTASLISITTVSATTNEMAERLKPCAGCHDNTDADISDQDYAPSISGKPAEYLYQQLLNYREGRRINTVMNNMLAYLSTDYLYEIAVYYAQLEVSRRLSDGHKLSDKKAEQARRLVLRNDGEHPGCTECHGGDLRGNGVAIPGLRNLSAAYITAQLSSWQNDTRHAREPDCMRDVARSLSGSDVATVALWIEAADDSMLPALPASQPLPIECGAVK